MCKLFSVKWFPTVFSLWVLHKSTLCSNADQALNPFFLRSHRPFGLLSLRHPPDLPRPTSWLCCFTCYLLQTNKIPGQCIKQASPNMAAAYQGGSWRIHRIQSQSDTPNPSALERSFLHWHIGFLCIFFNSILYHSYQELGWPVPPTKFRITS